MIYKYQSSSVIIYKVVRNLRLQSNNYVNDCLEWIGEALEAIGAGAQIEDKIKVVKTKSHRTPIPENLSFITAIKYGLGNRDKTDPPKKKNFPYDLKYGTPDLHPAIIEESSDVEVGAEGISESYLLDGNYIKTSFESDWIAIVYKGIATDNHNYPLVPKDYSFDQALYWYCVMKMLEGGYSHPNNEIGWSVAERRWLKYCTQARNRTKMPDPAKMEQFRRSWVRMIPNYDYGLEDLSEDPDNTIHLNETVTIDDITGL